MSTLNEILINATLTARPFVVGEYTVTVSEIPGGHRLAVTRGGQSQTADILDGVPPSLDELTEQVGKNTYMLDLLYKLTRGQAWDAEQKTISAYKTDVPAGAHAMALEMIAGRTIAFNQLVNTGGQVATVSGHKYFTYLAGVEDVITSNGAPITAAAGDMIIDLTRMFGFDAANRISDHDTDTAHMLGVPETAIGVNSGVLISANIDAVIMTDADGNEVDRFDIPADVKAKTGYGWSAGGKYNQILLGADGVWRYNQVVDQIMLKDLTWHVDAGNAVFYADVSDIAVSGDYRLMCDEYVEIKASAAVNAMENRSIKCGIGQPRRIYVRDDQFNLTQADFEAFLINNNVKMNYAINDNVVSPLPSMPETIMPGCEPDGKIELHQSNTNVNFKIAAQTRGVWFINLHEAEEALMNGQI